MKGGPHDDQNQNYDVARLKLLALVEMRGRAVVLTPIGVRQVANVPDDPEAPTLRLTVGGGEEGEIDALDLLRCRRSSCLTRQPLSDVER